MNELYLIDPFETEHAILSTLPVFQPKYTSFFQSSLEGRNVDFLQTTPLACFKETMTHLGAHFHGFGKALVKGANLAFRTIVQEGYSQNELNFKINHVFRSALQKKVDQLIGLDRHVVQALLDRAETHAKSLQVEQQVPFPIGGITLGNSTKMTFTGLGTIFISTSPEYPSIYNQIVVRLDEDKEIGDFYALLAFLDLEKSFYESSLEDQTRHKIGHLFRTFYPREAFLLERSHEFFDLPIDEIKTTIVDQVPEMASIFETYLDQMTLEEILPGRMRYRINGLARHAYDLGARGLTTALTGAHGQDLYARTAAILGLGLLSSETRKFLGIDANGLSTSSDFKSGGSDVVYTQMITEDNCRKNIDLNNLYYDSDIRLILSLDAIETGTYQYLDDAFGNRTTDSNISWGTRYTNRPGILEFITALQASPLNSLARRTEEKIQKIWTEYKNLVFRAIRERSPSLEALGIITFRQGHLQILGKNLEEFLARLRQYFFSPIDMIYGGHEVMIKERIPPKYIQRILVNSSKTQEELISYLKRSNIIQDNLILGHPVNEFIVVDSKASDQLFT